MTTREEIIAAAEEAGIKLVPFVVDGNEYDFCDVEMDTSETLERFYAIAHEAGAASRDAEVVSLTNQRDYEYVRAENAEQERDQLRAELAAANAHHDKLRKAVDRLIFESEEYDFDDGLGRGAGQVFWDELQAAMEGET